MLKRLGPWLDEHEAAFPMNPAADLAVIYDWQSASENQWTKPPAGWHEVSLYLPDVESLILLNWKIIFIYVTMIISAGR